MKHVRTRQSAPGFTLVELLVVIGIIALLISILLPSLNRARRSAKIVACLSNIRQISTATAGYIAENAGALPEATYSNKGGLSPRGTGQPAWSPITFNGVDTHVLPSIGDLLEDYLGEASEEGNTVWRCPEGAGEPFTAPPAGAYTPYEVAGPDPYRGTTAPDVWLPNYYYMANKTYITFSNPDVAATRTKPGFPAADWLVRNVSGLKAGSTQSEGGQGSSRIVVFLEYESTFHTANGRDIYNLTEGEAYDYVGNYGYLDGHAQTQTYEDRDGYMAQMSHPIPQRWYGVDFADRFAAFYEAENFYDKP